MKNAAPLLALIVVVIVATSLFLLKGTGSGPRETDLERTGVESVIRDDGATTAEGGLAELATSGEREAREAATTVDVAPAARLGGADEADDAEPAVTATLAGRVTDGTGRPLAGAEVRLAAGHGNSFSQFTFDSRERPKDTLVRTGADGRFETTVRAGDVSVAVGLDGYAPLERDVEASASERIDIGVLRLAEGVRLAGRVLDAGGNGVARASVLRKRESESGIQVFGGRQEPAITVTDSTGRFEITRQAAGPYDFVVSHEEHPPQPFSGRTERAGETRDGIVITLREGATVAGRVIDLPPSGAKGLRVSAHTDSDGGLGFMFDTRPGGPVTAPVDESGRFVLKGLESGAPVRISLFEGQQRWDGKSRRARGVSAHVGDRDVQIPYSEGATIRFHVVDESGDPIESIKVDAGFDFARPRIRREQVTENGEVTIANLWPEEGGQAIRLEIDATGFEPYRAKGLVVLPEEDRDVGAIVMKTRPQVILTVRSRETGAPVEGVAVTMRPYRDPADTNRSMQRRVSFDVDVDGDTEDSDESHASFRVDGEVRGTTDEDGRCALDATPGKTVEFLLHHSGYAETVDGPLVVSMSGSMTEHDIALEVGGSIRVTVADSTGLPVEGASIERRAAERQISSRGETQSHTTDASGVVTLTGLPAGELFFRLKAADLGGSGGIMVMDMMPGGASRDDGGDWTSVVVAPGETSELALLAPMRGAVYGIVREVGVPLAGASITLRRPKKGPMAGILSIGAQGPKTVSDARGEFRFAGIEEGEYELVISHATRAMEEVWPVEAEGRETEVEIELDVTIVEGAVFDENGEPVVGALVRPEKASSGGGEGNQMIAMVMITDDGSGGGGGTMITSGGTNSNEAYTDEDGQFTLRGVAAGMRIEITATADGYDEARSEAFEVDAGATHDGVNIQFAKPGKIRVAIENSPGGGMVMLRRRGEFRGQPRMEQFSGDSVTIDGVEPGDWTVRLLGGPGGDISTDPDEVEVTVVGGETSTAEFVVN